MHVYLVQHAEAHSEDADPARHLTEQGSRNARTLGRFLSDHGFRPSSIWHSGKTRSQETAQAIAEAFEEEIELVERQGMAPNDHPKKVLDELEKGVMIVGHMPFLSRLAASLVTGHEKCHVLSFQYARCACLRRENKSWSVSWMVDPEFL